MSDNPLSSKVTLDTTNYKAGVTELNRQLKVIESGFRASSAAMGDWDKTSEGMTLRIQALTGQISLQQHKVDELNRVYRELAADGKTSAKSLEYLQIDINKATETLNNMQNELKQSTTALDAMGNESKDSAGKVEDLGKKEEQTTSKSEKFKTAMSGLGSALKAGAAAVAGVATAVAGVGAAVGGMVLKTAASADSLQELSDKTGISVEKLQELSYVGKQVGTDSETITSSMAKMVRSMAGARDGTGDAADAFKTLGVPITDANGALRSSQDVFGEAITKLGQVGNETERDALSMAIFGKSAMELNPLIKAGSSEFARLSQEAHTVGAVMSTEAVQGMADLNDTVDSLKDGFKGTLGTLATSFLPGFKGMAGKAGGYLKEFAAVVKGADGDTGKMAAGIGSLAGKIVNDIAGQAPQLLTAGLGILKGIVSSIVSNLPTLMPAVVSMLLSIVNFILESLPMLLEAAIQIIITLATGISSALPTMIPTIVTLMLTIVNILLQNLPLLIQATTGILVALAQGLAAAMPILLPYIPQLIIAIVNAILLSLSVLAPAALSIITTLGQGLIDNMPALVESASQIVNTVDDTVRGLNSQLRQIGSAMIQGVWNGIQSQAAEFKQNLLSFFGNMVQTVKNSLGIKSPSHVFEVIGENVVLGLNNGFTNAAKKAKENIAAMSAELQVGTLGMTLNGSIAGAGSASETVQLFNYGNLFLGNDDKSSLGAAIKGKRY